jgi:tRNA pseudouridine38-40 synthase
MPRYFIELAYQGETFHGWQLQNNAVTVQELVNKSLSICLKTEIETTGCGRTDTGVHASQYFAHFDFTDEIKDLDKLKYSLNAILPTSIVIYKIVEVHSEAHARFDAKLRSYSYYITHHKNVFLNACTLYFPISISLDAMNLAASELIKFDDFACFSKKGAQHHTTICTVSEATWYYENNLLIFSISANRFLRGMVRAIVGTMLEVGQGKLSHENYIHLLNSKNRSEAGPTVEPQGLFLEEIRYPFIESKRRYPFKP